MQMSDRDVYLHTLPQFHCNGWGLLYSAAGVGATQPVIIRKIDGAEILRRVNPARRHLPAAGAPAVLEHDPWTPPRNSHGPVPGHGTTPDRRRGSATSVADDRPG